MSPHYKLTYFNSRGRAEHIRFIFAYAGVEYEDERIPKEKWPEVKKSTKYVVKNTIWNASDSTVLMESAVARSAQVARYLAREYGLAGKNEWESLQCDVFVDTLGDLKQGM
ncbi:hypothetical protein NQ317_000029 [Molorchus minor]|uniref:glutathione transferase n=1 Tax=Molorchus minor TaxID=1323400 RepID=A0ABQ9IQK9_9CUCU|nr:hypothetical protein NQ317_000029 [Molorchus minor]